MNARPSTVPPFDDAVSTGQRPPTLSTESPAPVTSKGCSALVTGDRDSVLDYLTYLVAALLMRAYWAPYLLTHK